MATVSSVVNQALRLANRVDPNYRQRALDAVDRNVRYFAERIPWPSLERRENFLVNGSEFFVFPARVRSIISIGDRSNQDYVAPGDHFERQYPSWELGTKPAGGPFRWRHLGVAAVIQNPAAATTLTFNTTASDSQTVYVKGLAHDSAASGTSLEYFETSEIVVAQETPAATTNSYVEVLSLEADTLDKVNDVIFKYTTGSVPAARIRANERRPAYQKIQWLASPAAGNTMTVRYYTEPPKIVSESHELDPQIPEDFLVWRTVGDLHWISEQPQAAQAAWDRADGLLQMKIQAQQNHGDRLEQAIPFAPFIEPDDGDVYD